MGAAYIVVGSVNQACIESGTSDTVRTMLAAAHQADIAMAAAPETDAQGQTQLRSQPVFCLLRANLLDSLVQFTAGGGRKIDAWTALHTTVLVPFDLPGDDPHAFFNTNTLAELQTLHSLQAQANGSI